MSLPQGYRQGIVTAITVVIAFTLTFLRFWAFEAEGRWSTKSAVTAITVGLGLIAQVVALLRALSINDDEPAHYAITVRIFATGIILIAVGVLASAYVFAFG